tara:strand:+ start:480 stop:614 length:135 start_codon:yes stop_codon:yes gene_type:complete
MTSLLMIAMTLPLVLIGLRVILMLEADNEDVGYNDWNFETQASK